MAQLVIAAAGAALGGTVISGGIFTAAGAFTLGAQIGWVGGNLIGQSFAPAQKSQGPRLSDLSVGSSAYGTPIPYTQGTPRLAGQIIWASTKREIATTTRSSGKGGGRKQKVTTYTYEVDLLILLTDNVISGVQRIWSNGKLGWNKSAGADAATIAASDATAAWTAIRIYSGAATQLPDPTYEAAVGTANAPGYRGRGSVFIQGLQLGQSGQIPNLTFELSEDYSISIGTEFFSSNTAISINGARVADDRALIQWQDGGTVVKGRIFREAGINSVSDVSSTTSSPNDLLAITATTFLAVWQVTSGTAVRGALLTTSGSPATSFATGTEYVLDTASSSGAAPFLGTISATQSLLVYTSTTLGSVCGQVVGIAGTVLSAGTITTTALGLGTGATINGFAMLSPTQGVALVTSAGVLYALAITVAGTTVTFGTPYTVPSAGSASSALSLAATGTGTAVAVYKLSTTELRSFVLTVSGLSVSAGAFTTLVSANCDWPNLAALTTSKLLLSYNLAGSNLVRAVPLNGSGAKAGPDIAISAGNGERGNVVPISATKAIVAWRSGTSPFNVTYNTVTVT